MIQEKLKQIQQRLNELLSNKIAALAQSKYPLLEEQPSTLTPCPVQADVAKVVWKNAVRDCVTNLATKSVSLSLNQLRQVTIIGGHGIMGRFFTQQLSDAGHNVNILERNDWDHADQLLSEADLVLICVPIEHTLDVIQKAAKYLNTTTALADITSIKTSILQAMLEYHGGPVLGLHPMFGPGVKSFLSQKVVVCPGRRYEAFQWLLNLIESKGGKLIVCTSEEHDDMMVNIQAIRHFSTFCLGVFMAEEEINLDRSLEFSSPIYRLEIDIVSRFFNQDGSLYISTILATEDRCEAIGRLVNTYNRLAHLVVRKDQAALKREFEAVNKVFREDAARALWESNHVINTLNTLLVASEVEQFTQQ